MDRRRWLTLGIVLAIPALALGWWLGSPLFLDTEVSEEFPMSAGADIPADMTREDVEKVMVEASEEPATVAEEPMPEDSGPINLGGGEFRDADELHMGKGTATVYELEDGGRVLRLEDFEVTNGPDLHVLLVRDSDPTGRDDVIGYLDLGSLKGNIGDQNYEIPADVDLAEYGSVVIYCKPFHVVFAVASLTS